MTDQTIHHRAALAPRSWASFGVFFAFLVVLVMALMPSIAAASGTVPPPAGTSNGQFVIKSSDYFINYLMKGMLGDVINPNGMSSAQTITGQGTMGDIFRPFNLGVTFFGSLMVMFLAVIGILNSGHDGEFLGRRWSSMWVPIRFAAGAALLLPVTNAGYSFVQAMCLWIAMQGVGFADNVWSAILDKVSMRTGSDIIAPVALSGISSNVMNSNLCKAFYNQRIKRPIDSAVYGDRKNYIPITGGVNTYSYGWGTWNSFTRLYVEAPLQSSDVVCGVLQLPFRRDALDLPSQGTVQQNIRDAHMMSIQALDTYFAPIADNYIRVIYSSETPGAVSESDLLAAKEDVKNAVFVGSYQYKNLITAATQAAISGDPKLRDSAKMAPVFDNLGFATAGAFYIELAKVQSTIRNALSMSPSYTGPDYETISASYSAAGLDPVMKAIKDVIAEANVQTERLSSDMPAGVTGAGSTTVQTIDLNKSMFDGDSSGIFESFSQSLSYALLKVVVGVGDNNNSPYTSVFSNPSGSVSTPAMPANNRSVIMELKGKGDSILNMAGMVWTTFIAAKVAHGAIDGSVWSKVSNVATLGTTGTILSGIGALLEAISGFIFTIVLSLVALGVTLAVVIPMTPFMLWVMGIAGLLVLILESLVACMIWAVMLMHPSGEGITSDQSRNGLMILLNLFMRPSLMLMGMVGGIFLVDPVVSFVNDMFFYVFRSTQASTVTGLFITFGFISLYCTLILSIVKKAFSLIHVIPDAVLAWIGGSVHNLGMSDAADRAEATVGNSSSRATAGMQGVVGSMGARAAGRSGPLRSLNVANSLTGRGRMPRSI